MADNMRYRVEAYAVYQGQVYTTFGDGGTSGLVLIRDEENAPVPDGLEPDPNDPTRAFYVSPDQLDAWYESRWSFRWRGQPFDVIGSKAGKISGWYVGRELHLIADHLQRVDRDGWLGLFPLDEVTDLTEHREDRLAKWKEKHQR